MNELNKSCTEQENFWLPTLRHLIFANVAVTNNYNSELRIFCSHIFKWWLLYNSKKIPLSFLNKILNKTSHSPAFLLQGPHQYLQLESKTTPSPTHDCPLFTQIFKCNSMQNNFFSQSRDFPCFKKVYHRDLEKCNSMLNTFLSKNRNSPRFKQGDNGHLEKCNSMLNNLVGRNWNSPRFNQGYQGDLINCKTMSNNISRTNKKPPLASKA